MVQESAREAASEIGLVYSTDQKPGYIRESISEGFRYFDKNNEVIDNPHTLDRIGHLVIPPAWTDVWICPNPKGYLQATGRDSKGRRQAIYHPEWLAYREQTKFERLADFGRVLPKIREAVGHDLSRHGLPKEKVVAAVVRLLEESLIRVGNRQYAKQNNSYGLTTMENRHVQVSSSSLKFTFKGKSGKYHEIALADRRLAAIVKRCQDLPGQALFEYLNADLQVCEITSTDINDYLHQAAGAEFTAKDFRTWVATVETVRLLREHAKPTEKDLKAIVKMVAAKLGNTPAVCRRSYIHPAATSCESIALWCRQSCKTKPVPLLDSCEQFVLHCVLPRGC
jgi:DNA topoisomerase-1